MNIICQLFIYGDEFMDEKELKGKTSNYGEFVTSYFCWLGMDEQRKRAEELQKMTENKTY